MMMRASSLLYWDCLCKESTALQFLQHFSNVGTALVIAVCCNISTALCHFWWTLTLKREGGQIAFCRFLLLQHIRFLTKAMLSLDSVISPMRKFRILLQGVPQKILCSCSLSGHTHWDLLPPITIQSSMRDRFNISKFPDMEDFVLSSFTSPLEFFVFFFNSGWKPQDEFTLIPELWNICTPIPNESPHGQKPLRKAHASSYPCFSFCLQVYGQLPCVCPFASPALLKRLSYGKAFICSVLLLNMFS